jgi:hypothetical protein
MVEKALEHEWTSFTWITAVYTVLSWWIMILTICMASADKNHKPGQTKVTSGHHRADR